jgi:hypothetical protein
MKPRPLGTQAIRKKNGWTKVTAAPEFILKKKFEDWQITPTKFGEFVSSSKKVLSNTVFPKGAIIRIKQKANGQRSPRILVDQTDSSPATRNRDEKHHHSSPRVLNINSPQERGPDSPIKGKGFRVMMVDVSKIYKSKEEARAAIISTSPDEHGSDIRLIGIERKSELVLCRDALKINTECSLEVQPTEKVRDNLRVSLYVTGYGTIPRSCGSSQQSKRDSKICGWAVIGGQKIKPVYKSLDVMPAK